MPAPSADAERPSAGGPVPAFRPSAPFTLGIEEELLLVEPTGLMLTPAWPRQLDGLRVAAHGAGTVAGEVSAAEIELITPVCRDVGEARRSLHRLRAAVGAAGLCAIAVGVHPAAPFDDLHPAMNDRYESVISELGGLLRTPTAALQVHVGMPDAETAIRVHNALRSRLPLLQALSADSPFWHGRDSRLASARAAILRSYPRAGLPPAFCDYDTFVAVTSEVAAAAEVRDYTYFWWDVRPHPRLGTVEVRAMDSQWSLERTAALAALVHGIARRGADHPQGACPSHEALAQSHFRAARDGLRARLLDEEGRLRPVPELAREEVATIRPYLAELGAAEAIDGIEGILLAGDEADRQRAIHDVGGMGALLHDLVRRTMEGG